MKRMALAAIFVATAAGLVALAWWSQRDGGIATAPGESGRVAVEAADVRKGSVADVREFTGTIEAGEAFTVAPKTGGQVDRIHVDIGDRVERGRVLAELDDDEARQAVAEAEAELAVARAELKQARADARLAERELERTRTLAERNLTSQSELDTAQARAEAQRAAIAVATARVTQREAALARARVQLGHTAIRADWPGSDTARVVGERLVSTGDTVAANTALLTILGITPIKVVITASEADYAPLMPGQDAAVTADAFPERTFSGKVQRIAPRFAEDSRQARVEVTVPNEDGTLKPGMFATVRITLDRVADATLVPRDALIERDDETGVYVLTENDEGDARARYQRVEVGIRGDEDIQILEPGLSGRVVTLGQQMLEDGAPVVVSELPDP